MATRWICVVILAGCLAGAAQAQGGGGCSDPCQMYPGPMRPEGAPPGPGGDLSLSADTPNAFDPDCRSRADYCCNGMWFSVEYLLWWFRSPRTPPLANISTGDPPLGNGAIGQPGTINVISGRDLRYIDPFSGARVNAGFWLGPERTFSIEGSGFVLEKNGTDRTQRSDPNGVPLIAIPFVEVNPPVPEFENSLILSSPGLQSGGIAVLAASRLWGAEANLVCTKCCCCLECACFVGF